MKQQLLLFLIFICFDARADWKLYGERDGGQGFYNPKTVQMLSKDKVKVVTYINLPKDYVVYRTIKGKPIELSHKIVQQYDCKKGTFQFIETESYSENHLHGKLLRHATDLGEEPTLVDKSSPSEKLFKILCNK